MELLKYLIDFILHLDHHLQSLIEHYGTGTCLILFLIIFCETGFVVTPFLPGDSLLFAVGAFTAKGAFRLDSIILVLALAAILGNTVNYTIGRLLAPRIFRGEKIRFLNQKYLERTRHFFEKYGGKTIIITRFVPIVRTFAPFLAGVGAMTYRRFQVYNIIGGIAWAAGFILCGYFFGNLSFVRRNFTLVIFAIIFLSLLPAVFEYINHKRKK